MFDLRLWCYCKARQCVKQICLLGVVCKVSNRTTLSGETFSFLEKRLAHTQLSWNVLFSCNLICPLCLSGPGYSSHTVNVAVTKISSCPVGGN